MSTLIGPISREQCLLRIEELMGTGAPLQDRLQRVAALVGSTLGVQRVAIYGHSQHGDRSVRVREEWTAPGRSRLNEWIESIPLITDRPADTEIVVAAPRGTHCPSDCAQSVPRCALRGACSSIIEPLRVGADHYGSLALHDHTRNGWTEQQVSLTRNVAKRIAIEIATARHAQVARQLDAQRSGIAATALHQVATPVTIIAGVIDRLTHSSDESTGLLRLASAEVEKLQRLCRDLAAISSGGAWTAGGIPPSSDLGDIVKRSVEAAREQSCGRASIDLSVQAALPHVICDPGDLQQIVSRVIENAALYAGEDAHIEVSCQASEGRVIVRVRDDGSGLTAAQASVLGEPFARLDPDMRTQPGGRGLSLAIGRQLARARGGDLTIEPRGDRTGAQVTLMLPSDPGTRLE